MDVVSTYSVKIKHYNHIFNDTVSIYREAVDFLIKVCLTEWNGLFAISSDLSRQRYVERLCHKTSANPVVKYNSFDKKFYKFPSYLRRSAITDAIGKVSSYKSNHAKWESADTKIRGKEPSYPKAGNAYPCLYKDVMYNMTGAYEAKVKVFIRNTWDWMTVKLRKSDIDYINRNCYLSEKCSPTLQKRGHEWFLDFPFKEKVKLNNTKVFNQTIVAVDLGINSAATVSAMRSDGTVLGRYFCNQNSCIYYEHCSAL